MSINPDEYKYISIDEAAKGYAEYMKFCIKGDGTLIKCKPFREWLITEI